MLVNSFSASFNVSEALIYSLTSSSGISFIAFSESEALVEVLAEPDSFSDVFAEFEFCSNVLIESELSSDGLTDPVSFIN